MPVSLIHHFQSSSLCSLFKHFTTRGHPVARQKRENRPDLCQRPGKRISDILVTIQDGAVPGLVVRQFASTSDSDVLYSRLVKIRQHRSLHQNCVQRV